MRCGKVYKFKRILNRHLRYECGLEPQFACPHCPYKGKRNTSLQSHMMLKHQIFIPLTHVVKIGTLQQSTFVLSVVGTTSLGTFSIDTFSTSAAKSRSSLVPTVRTKRSRKARSRHT
ncbi:hypothetical protein J6590_014790 [Homalodisca vitripennis]|nr:hypothetical protein J6590_014790 [Homalodisca vitripennis]